MSKINIKCCYCDKNIQKYEFEIKNSKNNFCSRSCISKYYLSIKHPMQKYNLHEGLKLNNCMLINSQRSMGRRVWQCLCDCGNMFNRRCDYITHRLKNNEPITCGCINKSYKRREKHPQWKGCGELSSSYMSSIKTRAISRGIPYEITIEQAWKKFLDQNKKCALSGVNLTLFYCRQNGINMTASLDRIDSSKGYTIDNIQWVHKDLNLLKKDYDNQKFINWCHLISKYNSS